MKKFTHYLKLTSKFNSSVPGGWYYDPVTARLVPSKIDGSFPVSRTSRMPAFVPKDQTGDLVSREYAPLPANGLRGSIRKRLANVVIGALRARGEEISFRLTHILLDGAATAKPASLSLSFEQASPSRSHPVVGLLGGGPVMIPSSYKVGDGLPVCTSLANSGLLPRNLADGVEVAQDIYPASLTAIEFDARKDSSLRATGNWPMDIVKNGPQELAAWLALLGESRKNKKDEDAAKKAAKDGSVPPVESSASNEAQTVVKKDTGKIGLDGVTFREYIVPGVWMVSQQSLDDGRTGEASLGLYLLSLVDFANEKTLGGCSRVGYGKFEFMSYMETAEGPVSPIINRNGTYVINDAIESVAKAVKAWKQVAAKLTGKELNDLFFVDAE